MKLARFSQACKTENPFLQDDIRLEDHLHKKYKNNILDNNLQNDKCCHFFDPTQSATQSAIQSPTQSPTQSATQSATQNTSAAECETHQAIFQDASTDLQNTSTSTLVLELLELISLEYTLSMYFVGSGNVDDYICEMSATSNKRKISPSGLWSIGITPQGSVLVFSNESPAKTVLEIERTAGYDPCTVVGWSNDRHDTAVMVIDDHVCMIDIPTGTMLKMKCNCFVSCVSKNEKLLVVGDVEGNIYVYVFNGCSFDLWIMTHVLTCVDKIDIVHNFDHNNYFLRVVSGITLYESDVFYV